MSKTAKVILGILTFLPLVFVSIIICMVICMAMHHCLGMHPSCMMSCQNAGGCCHAGACCIMPLIVLISANALVHLGLLIFYIVHLVRSTAKESEKIMWVLLFIFFGMISFIIYYFVRVVPSNKYLPEQPAS